MKFLLCILLLANASAIYGKVFPDAISELLCRRSDPNLNECLLNNAGKILPLIINGVPSANIDPLDPLNMEFMASEGEFDNVKVKMVMKNITLYGGSNTKINKVKIDLDSLTGEISLSMPYLRMTCDYFATGRLFIIPLESSAHFDGDFENSDITVYIRLKEVKRKGTTYYAVDKLTETWFTEKSHINLTSILPAEQPAVNLIQNFYNENNRLVLDTVNPFVVLYGPPCIQHYVDRFLKKVPAEELFPK